MYKTDVRAPTLVTRNLFRLIFASRSLPKYFQVHIVIAKVPNWLSQLAGADPPVEVDDGRRFAGRARHGPGCPSLQILKLSSVMERQRADVGGFLDPF